MVAEESENVSDTNAVRRSIRALAVDDNATMAKIIADYLRALPAVSVVGVAFSGESALELAVRIVPHLVVTDLDMPGMGGLQLLKELRKRLPTIRVIAVSAHEDGPWRKVALQAGADAFLPKRHLDEQLAAE